MPHRFLRANTIGYGLLLMWVLSLPLSTALTNIVGILMMLVWIMISDRRKLQTFIQHPVMPAILMLVALSVMSTFYTNADINGIKEAALDLSRLLSIGVLIYLFNVVNSYRLPWCAFLLAMFITFVMGFLKLYLGLPIGEKYVAGAVFKHHIITSYFMATTAFVLANWAMFNKKYRHWCLLGLALSLFYLLFMNVGRVGYVALIIYGLYFIHTHFNGKSALGALALLGALMLFALSFSPFLAKRIQALQTDIEIYETGGALTSSSLGSRLEFIKNSIVLIKKRPLFGWGMGSFATVYEQHYHNQDTLLTTNPHNELIRITFELGLVGLLVLIIFFVSLWYHARTLDKEPRVIFRGILLAFCIGCSANSWLMDFTELSFFCFFVASFMSALPSIAWQPQSVEAKYATE